MNNKLMDSFIASNKVIRHEIGRPAADILAELHSKHTYWHNKKQLQNIGGVPYFFTSLNDLRSETGYSKNVISKHIKILTKHGLVKSIRQGLNKPNLYSINRDKVNSFITKHENSFKDWQKGVRDNKPSLSSAIRKHVNSESGTTPKGIQETSNKCTTKNIYTKNTYTKNTFTNRASSGKEAYSEEQLEKLIEDIKCNPEEHRKNYTSDLFEFLCKMVPEFQNFKMSEKDRQTLTLILSTEKEAYYFCVRIVRNANDINEGKKEKRFQNLFVGVEGMITNYNSLFQDEK
jgi:DNA-binding transcriptional ArsR family regulator